MYLEGEKAKQEVARLHSKGEVNPGNAYIARYRNFRADPVNKADIWLTESDSNSTASTLVETMTARMDNSLMFTRPRMVELAGYPMYYTQGTGMYHYYYAKGKQVVWIGINNPDISSQEEIVLTVLEKI